MNTWEMLNLLTPTKKAAEKKQIYKKFSSLIKLTDWSIRECKNGTAQNLELIKYYFSSEVRDLFFPGKEFYWKSGNANVFLPEKLDPNFWTIFEKDIPMYEKIYDVVKVLFTINLRNLLPEDQSINESHAVYAYDYTLTDEARELLEGLYVIMKAGHENFFTEAEIKSLSKNESYDENIDELCLQEYIKKLSYGYAINSKSLFHKK